MSDRALHTAAGNIACIEKHCIATVGPSKQDQDNYARARKFQDWNALHNFLCAAALLTDPNTLELRRVLPGQPEDLWSYISDPAKLKQWTLAMDFEPVVGAHFQMRDVENWHGTIGAFDPPRRFRFDSADGGDTENSLLPIDEGRSTFVLRDHLRPDFVVPPHLEPDPTKIPEVQPGGPGSHWPAVMAGWHGGATQLRDLLCGTNTTFDYDGAERIYHVLVRDYHRKPLREAAR